MPIQPTYPGVYIQEVSSGVRTITGVSTSIAAFFGRTLKGPINKAVRCLSYSDFLREFGGGHPKNETGTSVKQFFDNGGTDCYVIRIAHNPTKADVVLENIAGTPVLKISAKNAGLWGNNLRLAVDYNTVNPDDSFNLRVTQEEGGIVVKNESFLNLSMNPLSPRYVVNFVSQGSKLVDVELAAGFDPLTAPVVPGFSQSRRPIERTPATIRTELNNIIFPAIPANALTSFNISINDGPPDFVDLSLDGVSFPVADNSAALIADRLKGKINAQLTPPLKVDVKVEALDTNIWLIRIISDIDSKLNVKITKAGSKDIAGPLMLGIDQGGIEAVRFAEHRPVPTATYSSGNINDLAKLVQQDITQFTFTGAPAPDVVPFNVPLPNILENPGGAPATDRWYLDPALGFDGVRQRLSLIANRINDTPTSPVTAEVWGYHIAVMPKGGNFTTKYPIDTGVAGLAGFFTENVKQYALGSAGGSFQTSATAGLEDDGNPLAVTDYTGSALDHTGFYALDRVDLFNLMIIPHDDDIDESEYQQLFGPATTYCNNKRAFLLLDAPASWTNGEKMEADAAKVNALRNGIVKDHSALFYPRVRYSDGGIIKPIGPSGMIAGLMARTDSQRGVWKAPAGIEADLRGVLDVELNMTDGENGVLNKLGVNCIRKFPNGIVNWGARTLDGSDDFGSEWKYIPIRRLALFLEESLFRGTKWVVFEPNDEPLWAKIRMNLNAFMFSLYRQGAFQGSTPDKAFYVKCDGETTTANDRNLGIVNIQVGFAPLKPAEFVIITIQQIPDV